MSWSRRWLPIQEPIKIHAREATKLARRGPHLEEEHRDTIGVSPQNGEDQLGGQAADAAGWEELPPTNSHRLLVGEAALCLAKA